MVDKDLQELIAKMNKSTQNLTEFEKLAKKIDEEDVQPRNIFKEIVVAYQFMRIQMGMRRRAISIDEFEVVSKQLKQSGAANKSTFHKSENRNYLCFLDLAISCCFSNSTWSNFDPLEPITDYDGLPPNIQQLTREIYEKRFGQPIPRPTDTEIVSTSQNDSVIAGQTPE